MADVDLSGVKVLVIEKLIDANPNSLQKDLHYSYKGRNALYYLPSRLAKKGPHVDVIWSVLTNTFSNYEKMKEDVRGHLESERVPPLCIDYLLNQQITHPNQLNDYRFIFAHPYHHDEATAINIYHQNHPHIPIMLPLNMYTDLSHNHPVEGVWIADDGFYIASNCKITAELAVAFMKSELTNPTTPPPLTDRTT